MNQNSYCKIYICMQKYKTLMTLHCPGMKRLTLVFRHEERDTQFLLCWLNYLTPQTRCASCSPALSRISTNCFFKITKFSAHCFRAWRHSHPSPIFSLGFLLWHLWMSYPLWTNVNTGTKSRIVQSPTKLNDKI